MHPHFLFAFILYTFSLHLNLYVPLHSVRVLTLRFELALVHILFEDSLRGIKYSWSGIRDGWSGIKGGKQSAGHEGSHGSGCSLSLDALGFHEERHLVTITIIFVMVTMIIIVITIPINTG